MVGLVKLVFSFNFLIGFLVGAGGLLTYLLMVGNKISFKKVVK